MNSKIKLSKHLTNSGCVNDKVLAIGQPGCGIQTMFLNHNIKTLDKIAVYQSYTDFKCNKNINEETIVENFGCIILFSFDTNPYWKEFLFKNIIKAKKPLTYYYPDIDLPIDECIIYKHLQDGWHSYKDKKMNFKNI